MPAKWVRIWHERRPGIPLRLIECPADGAAALVTAGDASAALARPDVGGDPHLSAIRLYEETPVVVVPKDHLFTAADEVTVADLAGEPVLQPLDDVLTWPECPGAPVEHRPETTADAGELVAAGIGVLVVPQSLARLHHRRDLVYRPIIDGPASAVALLWPEPTSDLVEEFIGIVRGRKATSSRGDQPAPKRSAREKALAKQARRAAAGGTTPNTRRTKGRGGRRG
ncbi:MAG: LysR substrate-binding domain-containing protein [Gordonia sp. (in: high G+C Gram-positive bacteria)]|uniref:LysR substrate-binding domain-containing protein n=1 Tax=Gordonia sp. (in: high G+C Gram-positive bacteria) TaxID=84139 RepID=UPI0039E6F6F4